MFATRNFQNVAAALTVAFAMSLFAGVAGAIDHPVYDIDGRADRAITDLSEAVRTQQAIADVHQSMRPDLSDAVRSQQSARDAYEASDGSLADAVIAKPNMFPSLADVVRAALAAMGFSAGGEGDGRPTR